MLVKKQLFFGYLFLFISISASLFYSLNQEYINIGGIHNDAFNYLDGYNYLEKNKFDVKGVQVFFGYGFPEFIYVYVLSILTFLTGTIRSVNLVMFLLSCCTLFLVTYVYLNINKIYSKNFSKSTIGLQLQILASTLPLGLTIQSSRQAFGFFLFLSVIIITSKMKFISFFLPSITLLATHFYSLGLIIGEYLVRKKKYFLLIFYVTLVISLLYFAISNITFYRFGSDSLIDFSRLLKGDKYIILSLFLLILIKGKDFLFDLRFLIFTCVTFFYFLVSHNGIFSRVLFGAGWFWVALLGTQIIGEVKLRKSTQKINVLCSLLCLIKIISLSLLL